ncbi:hypothetical protein I79_000284 [Cricetulus griseus]|uniref:Uncharacterized protein n=1 Tax=Cricetulus griseus TaxID=10029 RepID=G3GRY9_CRIGR|nr:hypothetical protein I79_000284 [Cricetulus griseus]
MDCANCYSQESQSSVRRRRLYEFACLSIHLFEMGAHVSQADIALSTKEPRMTLNF